MGGCNAAVARAVEVCCKDNLAIGARSGHRMVGLSSFDGRPLIDLSQQRQIASISNANSRHSAESYAPAIAGVTDQSGLARASERLF
jgi:hypothetical protein